MAQDQSFAPSSYDPVAAQLTADDEAAYRAANTQAGIPLDINSGIDWLSRLKVGAQRNKQEQLRVLRNLYGPDSIRLDKGGNFIARLKGDDGQPRDVLVDERSMSAKDLLDLTSEFPAFVLSVLTTKGVPASSIMRGALQGAAGYAAGGSITDAFARALTGQEVQPAEIASSRAGEAALNTAAGYGLGKVAQAGTTLMRVARGAASQMSTADSAAMATINAAREKVGARTGVQFEPTLAEITGNSMLTRTEAFLANIPFARNMILRNWRRTVENEKAVMSALGAGDEAPDLGERLIAQLSGETDKVANEATQAATAVRTEAQSALEAPLATAAGTRPLSAYQFGSRMIRRGEAQLDSFKTKANQLFEPLRNAPEATQPLFDLAPVQAKAVALRDSLLKEVGGNVARGVAPTGLLPTLEQVERLSPTQSWFELKDLRNALYDRMDSPEPISDKGTKMLKELAGEITQQMEKQAPSVFSPQLLAQAKAANQFYRDNVETFYQKGIAGMLKPRTEAGAIDPERIASSLLAGGKGSVTTYRTLANFFEKPQAVADMNRALAQNILARGTDDVTGLIKLEDLSGAVDKLEPEIVQALFNTSKADLLGAVKQSQLALRVTGKASIPMGGTQAAVELEELERLFYGGKITSASIRKLIDKTTERIRLYSNTIRKAASTGDTGLIAASPETFVDQYLFNPAIPHKDVANVMQSVYRTGDTELVADVRRAYLNRLFKSTAKGGKGDPTQHVARMEGSALQEIDPQKLALRFQGGPEAERAEQILGTVLVNDLRDFGTAIGGRAGRDLAGAMTGGFVGGGLLHGLLRNLQGLPEIAQYSILSYAMTNPKTLNMLRGVSQLAPQNLDKVLKAAVLSPEFQDAVTADSTNPHEARRVMEASKRWAEQGGQVPAQMQAR